MAAKSGLIQVGLVCESPKAQQINQRFTAHRRQERWILNETANLLFQLLYVLQQDHVVAAKITAVRCGGTLLLIPYPSMIGSADAGV